MSNHQHSPHDSPSPSPRKTVLPPRPLFARSSSSLASAGGGIGGGSSTGGSTGIVGGGSIPSSPSTPRKTVLGNHNSGGAVAEEEDVDRGPAAAAPSATTTMSSPRPPLQRLSSIPSLLQRPPSLSHVHSPGGGGNNANNAIQTPPPPPPHLLRRRSSAASTNTITAASPTSQQPGQQQQHPAGHHQVVPTAENVSVAVRVRPLSDTEVSTNQQNIWDVLPGDAGRVAMNTMWRERLRKMTGIADFQFGTSLSGFGFDPSLMSFPILALRSALWFCAPWYTVSSNAPSSTPTPTLTPPPIPAHPKDHVFVGSENESIYRDSVSNLVVSAMEGYNGRWLSRWWYVLDSLQRNRVRIRSDIVRKDVHHDG